MVEAPLTRASLLVRIRNGRDQEAWQQFVQLYAPVVYGFARKRGLQDADAADVMQDVLRSVAGAADRLHYDPTAALFEVGSIPSRATRSSTSSKPPEQTGPGQRRHRRPPEARGGGQPRAGPGRIVG